MSATLASTACPVLIASGTLINPYSVSPASSLSPVATGSTTAGVDNINKAIKSIDAAVQGAGGGGAYRVLRGLTLATDASLSLPVAAGQAALDGLATVPAATTLSVTGSITRAFIWLSQSGVLSAVNNSTTPPGATGYVFIGSVVTSGSAVTSVDTSGVPYNRGGLLFVEFADAGAPAWTVPAGLAHLAKTAGGLYFHDGAAYTQIG